MISAQAVGFSGFAIVDDVLDAAEIHQLQRLMESVVSSEQGRGGVRNLLDIPEVRELACSDAVMKLVRPILGEAAFPVRGILFDKKDGANWKVPWHQDVTIAVIDRTDTDGYGAWSMKQDVLHVQPPASVLEKMLSVRLHLDDCPKTNGALRVIPESHAKGKLSQQQIETIVTQSEAVTCEVMQGGALLMRPLLIHASSAADSPNHRRVIHFDYANVALDGGLQWREQQNLATMRGPA
jgi:ectoine hydroxylase-related dioxygenase (phytanoyl-CoA dioxygenase family)